MADIRLAKPAAGAAETVPCAPDARFVFDFPSSDATLARDGDNLNISFQDGSKLQLQDFYKEYNEENLPSFSVDGTDVTAQDFFQAMNEPDLMPAAGPGTGTVANGARFHEWGDSSLASGITHLNGLDWGFSRSFEWDDVPNAVGRNGDDWGWWGATGATAANNPVTLTPEDPSPVPPGTTVPGNDPENPTPPTPGNQGIVPPGDVRLVSEAGLRDGDSVSVNGAMRVGAPDGLASIEIGGRVIWQNGHMVGNPQFATDEGYFHNFAYDAASGRLTYTYTLTDATTEHRLPGADYIAHSLPLTVRDVDGDSASSNITIIIQDDVATSLADTNTLTEGEKTEVTGNLLANDTSGADGWMAGSLTLTDADGNILGATGEGTYGTLTIQPDGSYTYALSDEYKDGLPHDVQDEVFHYQVKDADGDVTNNTLTIDLVNVPLVPTGPQNPSDSDIKATSVAFRLEDTDAAGAAEATQTQTADLFNGPQAVTAVVFGSTEGIQVEGAAGEFAWDVSGDGKTLTGVNGDVTVTVTIEGFKDDGTVSMKAVMNDPAGHAVNSDSISITGIAVTGTDAGGSSATNDNVSITIVDAKPGSLPDTNTLTEGEKTEVKGNLLTNDTAGADGWMAGSLTLTDADGNILGATVEGTYGTLTIQLDGSYTYALSDEYKDGLPHDVKDEVFHYQVKDADGDVTNNTLTIDLVNTPLVPTGPQNPSDSDIKATSVAFRLEDTDAAGADEATQTQTADLFNGPQAVTAVVFGSTEGIQVEGAAGEFAWDVSGDGKTLTGVNGDVTVTVTIEGFKDDGTVSMKAVMNDPAGHAADSNSISITGIAVTGTDAGGSSATNNKVSITIVDAEPGSKPDEKTLTETEDPHASVSGNVLENDDKGADGWLENSVILVDKDNQPLLDADGNQLMELGGEYGTLTLKGDGSYTYTLTNGIPHGAQDEVFHYQVKDADGDVTNNDIIIKLENDPLKETKPGEDDLTAKRIEFTLKDVDAAANEGATDEKSADLFDGPQNVTGVVFGSTEGIQVEGAAGEFAWDVSGDGKTLTGVNGDVTVTVTIEGFKDDGTVSMKAVMNAPAVHAGDSDSISITGIAVTGTDAGGSTATNKNVSVTIEDDLTVWKAGSDTVTSHETLTSLNSSYNTHIKFTVDSEHVGATKADFASVHLTQYLTTKTSAKKVPWEGAPTEEKEFFWAGSGGPADETYMAKTADGTITITPTFVHYKYVEGTTDGQVQVDHLVDVANSIPRSAKALYLTEEGLTVGANKSPNENIGAYRWGTPAWNGTKPGEISVGSGKQTNGGEEGLLNLPHGSDTNGVINFESAYGTDHYLGKNNGIDSDNVSEAIVLDTSNGLISYGFNIGLGNLDGDDRVLLTFVMTPAHSSDDSIVKMVEITENMRNMTPEELAEKYNGAVSFDKDNDIFTIKVADGFTKVFVSALPKQNYDVDDGGFSAKQTSGAEESSGFTIKEVDFLTATCTSEGQVTGSSADGMAGYNWNFGNIPTEGEAVSVKGVGGGNYAVRQDGEPAENGNELTYTFKLSGGTLNGQTLFTATINTVTGEWSVTHFREFDMLNGKNPFQIVGTDKDGDTATIPLHITPQFTRFSNVIDGYYDERWKDQDVVNKDYADDILVGNDNNTLMYGKGGDDLLIGDSYDKTEPIDTGNSHVDKALEIILGATETKTNLNHVTATGGETNEESKVDTLYDILSKDLNVDAKLRLGEKLEAREAGTHGNDALYGGRGNDLLFGAGGDDFLSGDLGKDIIYGGGGNDIILYDKEDLYIDGGAGKDILVGGGKTPSLAELRSTENAENGPVVKNVEMLLRSHSDFTSSLEISSHKSLAENYGISITDAGVTLSADWTRNASLSTDDIEVYENANNGNKLTLEVYRTVTVMQPTTANTFSMGQAAGIAGEVGLLTALAAANGVEAAPVRDDDAAEDTQEAQAAASGLDAAAVSYVDAETGAPADAEAGTESQDGFESLIADLGEVTPAMLDGATEVRDTRYTVMDGDSEAQAVDRASAAAGDTHRATGEGAPAGAQAHGGDLPDGVEVIREGDGDDFIDAGEGSHAIYAGAGDDLIVYDATDYLIDGGSGIDFLLSGSADPAHSLADMLGNWEHKGADTDMPMVHDVEVMLKGVDTSLQNMDSLAARYGFSMDKDANGRDILVLDKGKWELDESQSGNGTNTYVNAESGITLETTLAEVGTGTDAGEQAAQTIVLANNG